ncbi:TraB/GumN family protein [Phaeovulum sp.]|uniref:TraB/GumN family protein n=1 Tax=Phaeovulum sp. TaxID=2934796 RepID=UPI0039E232E0
MWVSRGFIGLIAAFMLTAPQVQAGCAGENLFARLPAETQAQLAARADAAPYARGLLWRAVRGDQALVLLGTYHFADPRHAATLTALSPHLDHAKTLLVEAGPDEQAALKAAASSNPTLLFTTGATLPERMAKPEWDRLKTAFQARAIPAFLGAKFQPWYAAVTLVLSPCAMAEAAAGARGLDDAVMEAALARGLTIRALEPYDTVFTLFSTIPESAQIEMILSTLPMAEHADDYTATLADAYFAQQPRLIWEFSRHDALENSGLSPAQVAAQFALSEEILMLRRNRAWLPVIEAALTDGPVVLAAGALHLSGQGGLLDLLAEAGFTLTPLPIP